MKSVSPSRFLAHKRIAAVCVLIMASLAITIGVVHVERRQRAIRNGYRLMKASIALRKLQEENRRLRLEQSVLTDPGRIERLARAMGMQQPIAGQVRTVKRGKQ